MGNNLSKRPNRVHDFSFPFMDAKSADDWKLLEEERNKALLDKKRFAVRLSDVEELYSKKCDLVVQLENHILDLRLEKKKIQDKFHHIKLDYKICQIERTITLVVLAIQQKENASMKLLLRQSSEELTSTINDTQMTDTISSIKQSPINMAANQIVNKLLSELGEKDKNLSRLLQKLHVVHEEKTNYCNSKESFGMNGLTTSASQDFDGETISGQNSFDSLGTEKSIFPFL